jgi:hypothetical protein
MAEVGAERSRAERILQSATPAEAPSVAELRKLIVELGYMVAVLESAEPEARAVVYATLGLRLTWHPDQRKVLVEAQPARVLAGGVGGGGLAQLTHHWSGGR